MALIIRPTTTYSSKLMREKITVAAWGDASLVLSQTSSVAGEQLYTKIIKNVMRRSYMITCCWAKSWFTRDCNLWLGVRGVVVLFMQKFERHAINCAVAKFPAQVYSSAECNEATKQNLLWHTQMIFNVCNYFYDAGTESLIEQVADLTTEARCQNTLTNSIKLLECTRQLTWNRILWLTSSKLCMT